MQTFSDFGLNPLVLKAIQEMGYEKPTEIQIEAIPLLCAEPKDFIGLAQTGTGKTAAFGLPLLHQIDTHSNHVQALILSPTRELAQQIASQVDEFSKHMDDLYTVTVYGGANIMEQIRAIKRGVQIVIATPGRLLDLIKRRAINLEQIRTLVLDEADEMLNMGFKEDLDEILRSTPESKNTWLFSATMPKEIRRIVREYMSPDATEVSVNKGNTSNENIEHQYIAVKTHEKNDALKRYIDSFPDMRGIIFCRTKAGTQSLADGLSREGYGAEAIHGDLSQAQRDRVMKRFKDHQLQVLVATDVAARGIDVNDLTHVIHHALPDDSAYYTHRSGRTARAGKKGISIAFVSGNDQRKLKMLQRQFDQDFQQQEVPSLSSVLERRALNWVEALKEKEVSKKLPADIIVSVLEGLQELTKEEIVAKMLSTSFGSLMEEREKSFQSGSSRERPSRDRDRGRDRDSRGRDRERAPRDRAPRDRSDRDFGDRERPGRDRHKPEKTKEGFHRYFINVGAQDDLTKGTLIDFITDTSKVPRAALGDVRMLQKNSFFEVEEKHSKGFADQFSQIFVGDRPLRVNRDDDGSQDGKRSEDRRKPFSERRSGGGGYDRDRRGGGDRDRRSSDRDRRSSGGDRERRERRG